MLRALLDGLAVVSVEMIGKLGRCSSGPPGEAGAIPTAPGPRTRNSAPSRRRASAKRSTVTPRSGARGTPRRRGVQDTYLNSGTLRQRMFRTDDEHRPGLSGV